jgi:curli biogenesis system outer membrane secretion channel CsgG
MTRTTTWLIHVLMILLATSPARAQDTTRADAPLPPARPTLTVADFVTDRTGWMPPPHLGETLAELLTDRLVAAGPYRMVDREWLISAVDDRSRIPFPALLERAASSGVDYLIAGSVTRLSIEKKSSTGGGLLSLPIVGAIIKKNQTESVIGLTIRVIDVRTGEVVATSTAESGASQQTSSGGGVAIIGHVPLIGGKGSSVTGFQDRLLDTAAQQAITAAAEKIVAAAPRLIRPVGSAR